MDVLEGPSTDKASVAERSRKTDASQHAPYLVHPHAVALWPYDPCCRQPAVASQGQATQALVRILISVVEITLLLPDAAAKSPSGPAVKR